MLRSRRRQLHARIAAALEGRFPEIVKAQPALLAHHCSEAGLAEQAVAYWLAAGRQALARSAVAEAVAVLRRGLALVPALPDGERRPETALDLQIALGQALIASRGWGAPELPEVHAQARALASALNRPRALLPIEMRELGDATGDVRTQVQGCDAQGFTCFNLGEFAAGHGCLEKALSLYDPADRLS